MHTVDSLKSKEIEIKTGEEWSRVKGKRDFISFTDELDTALDYATLSPSKDSLKENNFGVIIGISSNDLKNLKVCNVNSFLPEIGIKESIPLEYIKVIAVPEDKVEFIRKLVGDKKIMVTPISIEEKFYYADLDSGEIFFDEEKAQKFDKEKEQSRIISTFKSKSIKKLAETRTSSSIQNMFGKIKEMEKNKGEHDGKYFRNEQCL